jgi:hypothetical protein
MGGLYNAREEREIFRLATPTFWGSRDFMIDY